MGRLSGREMRHPNERSTFVRLVLVFSTGHRFVGVWALHCQLGEPHSTVAALLPINSNYLLRFQTTTPCDSFVVSSKRVVFLRRRRKPTPEAVVSVGCPRVSVALPGDPSHVPLAVRRNLGRIEVEGEERRRWLLELKRRKPPQNRRVAIVLPVLLLESLQRVPKDLAGAVRWNAAGRDLPRRVGRPSVRFPRLRIEQLQEVVLRVAPRANLRVEVRARTAGVHRRSTNLGLRVSTLPLHSGASVPERRERRLQLRLRERVGPGLPLPLHGVFRLSEISGPRSTTTTVLLPRSPTRLAATPPVDPVHRVPEAALPTTKTEIATDAGEGGIREEVSDEGAETEVGEEGEDAGEGESLQRVLARAEWTTKSWRGYVDGWRRTKTSVDVK